jgi:hypothetical protein
METHVWNLLKDGKLNDVIEMANNDSHSFQDVMDVVLDFSSRYRDLSEYYRGVFGNIKNKLGDSPREEYMKEFSKRNHPAILISMLDGESFSEHIWDAIR